MQPRILTSYEGEPPSQFNFQVVEREIPQKRYIGTGTVFDPAPPIEFGCRGFYHYGVPLQFTKDPDFLMVNQESTGWMLDRAVAMNMISATSPNIMLRISWRGCQPFEYSICIQETVQGVPRRICKAKLVSVVGKFMERFYVNYKRGADWDHWSNLGLTPDKILFEDLVLLQLVHVSKGSYQPMLFSRIGTVTEV